MAEPHERLYLDQGKDNGWDDESFAQALCEAAGQPREALLRLEVRGHNAFAAVKPESLEAFLAANGKPLKDKPLLVERARAKK